MERTIALAVLIALVFAFFSRGLQERLREALARRPGTVWVAPALLTALFAAASAVAGVSSVGLTGAILAYTAAPTLCTFLVGAGTAEKPRALDFVAILLLWLPLEFAVGASLVPRSAQ